MYYGWYQLAFVRELTAPVTATCIGDMPLMLVRDSKGICAFDPVCPHRGANLAFGGKLEGNVIICPFHGHRIGLSSVSQESFKVRSYRTITVGGLVFVLLAERHDNGFGAWLDHLNESHLFTPGFTITAPVPAELVIENGFDRAHFQTVHGLNEQPDLFLSPSHDGELNVQGTLSSLAFDNVWHRDQKDVAHTNSSFLARVFSPNLCMTRLGDGASDYWVISGATPKGERGCTIRVSVAVPSSAGTVSPEPHAIHSLLRDSKLAYEQDLAIWEHRFNNAASHFMPDDDLVKVFQDFCLRFSQA